MSYKPEVDSHSYRVNCAVMSARAVGWHAVMVQFVVCLLSLNWCGCILTHRNVTTCRESL
jgi:hypothetical protein